MLLYFYGCTFTFDSSTAESNDPTAGLRMMRLLDTCRSESDSGCDVICRLYVCAARDVSHRRQLGAVCASSSVNHQWTERRDHWRHDTGRIRARDPSSRPHSRSSVIRSIHIHCQCTAIRSTQSGRCVRATQPWRGSVWSRCERSCRRPGGRGWPASRTSTISRRSDAVYRWQWSAFSGVSSRRRSDVLRQSSSRSQWRTATTEFTFLLTDSAQCRLSG